MHTVRCDEFPLRSYVLRWERTQNIRFEVCSLLYGVWFGLVWVLAHFFTFGFGSVLGKTCVLVRFVLTAFGFFPISIHVVGELSYLYSSFSVIDVKYERLQVAVAV